MNGSILLYIGSLLTAGWGTAHLFPTRNIVDSFENISADNKRIITMEWVTEGIALIFIGLIVALATYIDPASIVSRAVYWASFGVLNVLSTVSLFTGYRNSFIAFKLCPFIFTGSSILIIIGSFMG